MGEVRRYKQGSFIHEYIAKSILRDNHKAWYDLVLQFVTVTNDNCFKFTETVRFSSFEN